MLSDEIKKSIQGYYKQLLERKGFKARYCQRLMIADIANLLGESQAVEDRGDESDDHIAVIEAGTGTGKTIAYLLACLPLAREKKKKLVLSTATVALQEQVLFRDLPDLLSCLPELDFTFALAKGRRRYACLAQLDRVLKEGEAFNLSLALYDDEKESAELQEDQREVCLQMIEAIGRGQWDGDRDRWGREPDDNLWGRISVDHARCSGRRCSYYENCCFYKAREGVYRADCIVANHDLVLSDLLMGGGLVLPAPEESIYVFDEAHHLPEKAVNHLSHFTRLRATGNWLEQLPENLEAVDKALGRPTGDTAAQMGHRVVRITEQLQLLFEAAGELLREGAFMQKTGRMDDQGGNSQYRFPGGDCTADLRQQAAILHGEFAQLTQYLSDRVEDMQQDMAEADVDTKEELEYWYPVVTSHLARADANRLLWQDYMKTDQPEQPPQARWITLFEDQAGGEMQLSASPVSIDSQLRQLLWERAWAAVLTSATLAIHGDFTLFARKTGLREDARYRVLPSPFDYEKQGLLQVPPMSVDPRQADAHTEAVAERLPTLLAGDQAALVLFTSWRQMNRVQEQVEADFAEGLIVQGELGKGEILRLHRERVDAGETSIIFGLASFAEGIDLPGKYCTHVVITKIPFAVPDDPITATYGEWLESRGHNAFMEISVPEAILKLKQACGRLIRTEQDTGKVTILDSRLLKQRYGRQILKALPAFRRQD